MSIISTADSIKRAAVAYKAAQGVAKATRGRFALVERRHSYSSLLHGAYAGYIGYTPAIVSSVTRDGIVKEARLSGQEWPLKRRDWDRITVDNTGMIADPAGVVAALADDRGNAIEFKDQAEAIIAIKTAAGIAP
jgi:hypothetical protein